jgi:hypothetical protein
MGESRFKESANRWRLAYMVDLATQQATEATEQRNGKEIDDLIPCLWQRRNWPWHGNRWQ